MTGARVLVGENVVVFNLPRPSKRSKVLVTLAPDDTYTVKTYTGHGLGLKEAAVIEEVYCDMLQEVFCAETGLFTSL